MMTRFAFVAATLAFVACGSDGGDRPAVWCCDEELPWINCYKGSRTKYRCGDLDHDGRIDEELECYDVPIDWWCDPEECGGKDYAAACYIEDRLPDCDCESRDLCPPECRWFCVWRGDVDPEQGCRPARVVELFATVGGGTGRWKYDACLPPETDCI